jgi:hypothetical protein
LWTPWVTQNTLTRILLAMGRENVFQIEIISEA